jgi:hypothetical protein
MYAYMSTCMNKPMHMYIHVNTHNAFIYTYMYVCVYIYYIYSYIYMNLWVPPVGQKFYDNKNLAFFIPVSIHW